MRGDMHVRFGSRVLIVRLIFEFIYLTGGFTANTTLSNYCRDTGLSHIHRAMHAVNGARKRPCTRRKDACTP